MVYLKESPAVGGRQGTDEINHVGRNNSTPPADRLLPRLSGLRETGPRRWIARCPAHDDRSPSLSVRETSDCTLLVHCFCGCSAAEVVAAVGLELRDLFHGSPPGHRQPMRRGERRIPASDALAIIHREALVVAVIAADILAARTLDNATWARLATAAARIGAAREVAI